MEETVSFMQFHTKVVQGLWFYSVSSLELAFAYIKVTLESSKISVVLFLSWFLLYSAKCRQIFTPVLLDSLGPNSFLVVFQVQKCLPPEEEVPTYGQSLLPQPTTLHLVFSAHIGPLRTI